MKSTNMLLIAGLFLLASCRKENTPEQAVFEQDIFLVNGNPTGGNFNFFSFATGSEVPLSDSISAKWDFAMRFEKIIVNSGVSGPGQAGVQILNTPYDLVTEAPQSGYKFDTSVTKLAVKGEEWYTYNSVTRTFSPIAGKTFVFRTATNKYAKLEILSADPADNNGNPVVPPTRPTKIKYKIRIAYQPDGSRILKTPPPITAEQKDFLVSGNPTGGNHNFFSFALKSELPLSDSLTTKWDFAMRFEKIIVNSGISGPGQAGVQIINQPFDLVNEAPQNGYKYDTTASQLAVKGADWYIYNSATRTFSPIAGRTFVFRTATNKYAKLEILTAEPTDDNGNPVIPPTRPTKIKYKIRFAYQPDGSRFLISK